MSRGRALSVSGLSKSFDGHPALRAVSFEIEQGEMVALIGASGAGKSTLLRLLAGLLPADSGSGESRVDVLGRPMQEDGRLARGARLLRRDVAMIFQRFNLVDRLSVLANTLLGSLGRIAPWQGTLGLFPLEDRRLAMQALSRVGIAHHARRRADTLSGGEQQRAAIARALVQRAPIILADEPIASLDPTSARQVMDLLERINTEDGLTVLVSLHQVNYAMAYCPRTIALRDGRVVYDGPTSALTEERLSDLYGEEADALTERVQPRPGRQPKPRLEGHVL